MALIALLLGPVATLQRHMGDALCQSIFLDDRAAVVRTVEAVEEVIDFWAQAAGAMGLEENAAKLKVVTRCGRLRQQLLDRGVDTSLEATVLGTAFREDGQTAVEGPRLDNFRALFQRLSRLPVVSKLKHGLYRRILLPQLLWSFWWAPVSSEETAKYHKLTSLVRRTLGVVQFAARDLWLLLSGHWMDVGFALGLTSVCAFLRADAFWRQRGQLFRDGRWGDSAHNFLTSWGFTQVRPHRWHHEEVGGFDFADGGRAELRKAAHLVREAWRRTRFRAFLQGTRHELVELAADFQGYDERWLKAAIQLYNKGSTEERHVMLGGCVSEEQYARMHGLVPQAIMFICSVARFVEVKAFLTGFTSLGTVVTLLVAGLSTRCHLGLGDLDGLFVEKVLRLPMPGFDTLAWCVLRSATASAFALLDGDLLLTVTDYYLFLDGYSVEVLLGYAS